MVEELKKEWQELEKELTKFEVIKNNLLKQNE